VRIAGPDTTVTAVDNKFRLLVLCNLPCAGNRLCLGTMDRGGMLPPFRFDCPSVWVRYNVLIAFRHVKLLKFSIAKEVDIKNLGFIF
jgi:hypothetical protein